MLERNRLREIANNIQSFPEFRQCRIVYTDDKKLNLVLAEGVPSYSGSAFLPWQCLVVLEERAGIPGVTIVQPPALSATDQYVVSAPDSVSLSQPDDFVAQRSTLGSELQNAGLSCGAAVLTGGAIGETGGLAGVLLWTSFSTSSIECVNHVVRSAMVVFAPDDLQGLDRDKHSIYNVANDIVEDIGTVSTILLIPANIKGLISLFKARGGLLDLDQFAKLTRSQKVTAIKNSVVKLAATPEGRKELSAYMRKRGLTDAESSRILANGTSGMARGAKVLQAVKADTLEKLQHAIADALLSSIDLGKTAVKKGEELSKPARRQSQTGTQLLVHIIPMYP